MTLCSKHNKEQGGDDTVTTFPQSECAKCIENAFDPKKCMICREKDGCQIADGLVVCPKCEEAYFSEDLQNYKKLIQKEFTKLWSCLKFEKRSSKVIGYTFMKEEFDKFKELIRGR